MGRSWWPGPAHQFFRGWAAARPSPSHLKKHGPAWPGPSFFPKSRPGPARPGPLNGNKAHETRALYGPARQLRGPARGFDGPAHGRYPVLQGACAYYTLTCFFCVNCVFFLLFSRLDSVGEVLSAHETHITSTHYSHNSAP